MQKTAIEYNHNLDGSIEDNVKNWDKLSLAEQKSVKGAIKDVEDLIKTMDRLPSEHYINILIADGKIWQYEDNRKIDNIYRDRAIGNYNPIPNIDQTLQGKLRGTAHATGGILTRPHIGLVAEAGPEAIIPLSGINKERGKELWLQSGRILGTIPAHATGGIFGNKPSKCYIDNQDTEPLQANNTLDIKAPISINLGGINITIEGNTNLSDNKSIVKSIREEMPTITNDLCEQMAVMLEKVFSNMTLEAQ